MLYATDAPLRHVTVGTLVLGLRGEQRGVDDAKAWISSQPDLSVEDVR